MPALCLFVGNAMAVTFDKIVDISLELDPRNFAMRTPAGFTKDLQFAIEVLKEHDAPGGAGQVVRGVHMRLHARHHPNEADTALLPSSQNPRCRPLPVNKNTNRESRTDAS